MTSGSFCSCWTLSNLALIFTSLSPQSHEKGSKKTKPPEQITGFPLLNTSLFGWPLWPLYSLCVSVWVKVCVLCAAHSPFWKLRLWAANEKKTLVLCLSVVRLCMCVCVCVCHVWLIVRSLHRGHSEQDGQCVWLFLLRVQKERCSYFSHYSVAPVCPNTTTSTHLGQNFNVCVCVCITSHLTPYTWGSDSTKRSRSSNLDRDQTALNDRQPKWSRGFRGLEKAACWDQSWL